METTIQDFKGKHVLITGGTDGIGAATALLLQQLGAAVWIIGRSQEKGEALVKKAEESRSSGRLSFIQADFSLMKNVVHTAELLRAEMPTIDLLIHCVGILITKTEHTPEGVEKDFAVGYLSRFILTKKLVEQNLLTNKAILINLAASGPKVPKVSRLEFDSLAEVEARVGMKSHGQAQIANDLFSLEASQRFGLAVIGYGPGSVATNIRRELPTLLVALLKPFYAFSTRKPEEVAHQLVDILQQGSPPAGETVFFDKNGRFQPDPFVLDQKRRNDLWQVSEALAAKALGQAELTL